jgi:uncharacterized protein (DUF58 family)
VTLTGRAGLIALICMLPIGVSPWPATAFVVLLALLLVVVAVDAALAANTRNLRFSRVGDTAARLGEAVSTARFATHGRRRPARSRASTRWTSLPDNGSGSIPCCGRCAVAIRSRHW